MDALLTALLVRRRLLSVVVATPVVALFAAFSWFDTRMSPAAAFVIAVGAAIAWSIRLER